MAKGVWEMRSPARGCTKLLIGLIVFFLVSFLAAAEVTIWTWYGGVMGQILSNIIKSDFTAKTGIEVKIVTVPEDDSHFQSYLLSYIGGNAPDIIEIYSHHAGELGMRQALTDLTTFPDSDEVFGKIPAKLLDSVSFKNAIFAVPSEVNWAQMYYRKDVLADIGVEPPNTWDELGRLSIKLLAYGRNTYYEFQGDNQAAFLYYPFVWQKGIDIYNEDGTASNLDAPEAVEAFLQFTDLYTTYGLVVETPIVTTFASAETPVAILQNWYYSVFERTAPQVSGLWGIAEMPGTPDKDGKLNRTNTGKLLTWGISESSTRKKEAWELLKFLASEEFLVKFSEQVYNSVEKWRLVFSNANILPQSPFPEEVKGILDSCLNDCRLKRVVPGGYVADRYVEFVFNKVVVGKEDPKKAILQAANESTIEIQKKIKEFSRFLDKLE
jgi:ABC-type glycerol-3-phosphate transport system substrate-binding protein